MPDIPMRRRRFYATSAFVFNESGVILRLSPIESWYETVAPTIVLGAVTLTLPPIESWYTTGGNVDTAFDIVKETILVSFTIDNRLQDSFIIAGEFEAIFHR